MVEADYNPITEINDDGKLLDLDRWAVFARYYGAQEKEEEDIKIALNKYCEENNCQVIKKTCIPYESLLTVFI